MSYRLGLPAWAFPGWKGPYFPPDRPMLESYATVLNAVEGNTTFYRVPDAKTISAWRQAVAGRDFRFCLKLPRNVTHERRPNREDLKRFLAAIEPLGDHLGPLFVQFPATLGPDDLPQVERLFEQLPRDRRSVIEVRHRAFFDSPALLEPLLESFDLGRVSLDSRPLYEGDREHPEVQDALHEKPDLSVLPKVYNGLEFVRLILHPDLPSNESYIREWAGRIARSIANGYESYMMIHCPNNMHCPPLAKTFHETLMAQAGMGDLEALPDWPVPQQGRLI